MEPEPWLDWARRLQAISQNGLLYAGFFGSDALPGLSVRTDARRLARAWSHWRDRSLPTHFD